jgi:hypothetical protein
MQCTKWHPLIQCTEAEWRRNHHALPARCAVCCHDDIFPTFFCAECVFSVCCRCADKWKTTAADHFAIAALLADSGALKFVESKMRRREEETQIKLATGELVCAYKASDCIYREKFGSVYRGKTARDGQNVAVEGCAAAFSLRFC